MINENAKNAAASSSSPKTSDDSNKTPKDSKSSSATTLAALLPGDSTTLPVKKRSKLRHRLSDVGSWGLRKKDRARKYRSMNIESLEVLGDPVIEDTFFVSLIYAYFLIIILTCQHGTYVVEKIFSLRNTGRIFCYQRQNEIKFIDVMSNIEL